MADITMSLDDTLELDTIIEESNEPLSSVTVTNGTDGTDFKSTGIKTGTYIFNPISSGTYNLNVNGQELSVEVTDPSNIPDSEDFEHNDLTGVYGGDTGHFQIQTGTVNEGTYALESLTQGTSAVIVRSTEDNWNRDGIRILWDQYNPNEAERGKGGLALATSVTGFSNMDGYTFYADTPNTNRFLRRIDGGSTTNLDSDPSSAVAGDQWITASAEFDGNGNISFTFDGVTLTGSDDTYTSLLLGFFQFEDMFIDNVRFETI